MWKNPNKENIEKDVEMSKNFTSPSCPKRAYKREKNRENEWWFSFI